MNNYSIGDKAIIVNRVSNHQFKPGTIVEIVEVAKRGFKVSNGLEERLVLSDDLFPSY